MIFTKCAEARLLKLLEGQSSSLYLVQLPIFNVNSPLFFFQGSCSEQFTELLNVGVSK